MSSCADGKVSDTFLPTLSPVNLCNLEYPRPLSVGHFTMRCHIETDLFFVGSDAQRETDQSERFEDDPRRGKRIRTRCNNCDELHAELTGITK